MVMVPAACSIFPQRWYMFNFLFLNIFVLTLDFFSSLKTSTMELLEKDKFKELNDKCKGKAPKYVYFNKGL